MTYYSPENLPVEEAPKLVEKLVNEFRKIFEVVNSPPAALLEELNVAPKKPRTGLTVLADGTNWNPGTGQGVYTYYAGAWHKLG